MDEILNAGGTLEGSVTYDAFGNITSGRARLAGDMAFPGMMLDRTTGFNEAKYRFELPDGQWTAQDQTGLGPDVNDRREMGNDAVNGWTQVGWNQN